MMLARCLWSAQRSRLIALEVVLGTSDTCEKAMEYLVASFMWDEATLRVTPHGDVPQAHSVLALSAEAVLKKKGPAAEAQVQPLICRPAVMENKSHFV